MATPCGFGVQQKDGIPAKCFECGKIFKVPASVAKAKSGFENGPGVGNKKLFEELKAINANVCLFEAGKHAPGVAGGLGINRALQVQKLTKLLSKLCRSSSTTLKHWTLTFEKYSARPKVAMKLSLPRFEPRCRNFWPSRGDIGWLSRKLLPRRTFAICRRQKTRLPPNWSDSKLGPLREPQ